MSFLFTLRLPRGTGVVARSSPALPAVQFGGAVRLSRCLPCRRRGGRRERSKTAPSMASARASRPAGRRRAGCSGLRKKGRTHGLWFVLRRLAERGCAAVCRAKQDAELCRQNGHASKKARSLVANSFRFVRRSLPSSRPPVPIETAQSPLLRVRATDGHARREHDPEQQAVQHAITSTSPRCRPTRTRKTSSRNGLSLSQPSESVVFLTAPPGTRERSHREHAASGRASQPISHAGSQPSASARRHSLSAPGT